MQVMDGAACLDEELIAAFVVGSLSASERVQVEEHLAECDACLSVVSAAAYGCVGAPAMRDLESRPSRDRALLELHHELLDGALPGRFRLLDLLGRGGTGTVWRAYDGMLRRTVALEVLPGAFGRERTSPHDPLVS